MKTVRKESTANTGFAIDDANLLSQACNGVSIRIFSIILS